MGSKNVRRNEYYGIKTALNNGMSYKDAHDAFGRGRNTLSAINRSKSFADFKVVRKTIYGNYHQKTAHEPKLRPTIIRRDEFDTILLLAKADLKDKKIAEIVKRSPGIVAIVRKSGITDYDQWLAYRRAELQAIYEKRKAEKENQRLATQQVELPAPESMPVPRTLSETIDVVALNQVLQNVTDGLNAQSVAFNTMSEKMDDVLETKRPWLNRLKG